MASCVVSWWMRASLKCGMPTTPPRPASGRAGSRLPRRQVRFSQQATGRAEAQAGCARLCRAFRRSREKSHDAHLPMDGTGLACDVPNGCAISGDGRRRNNLLDRRRSTRRMHTFGQEKKNRKLLTSILQTLGFLQAGLSAELNDRLESRGDDG